MVISFAEILFIMSSAKGTKTNLWSNCSLRDVLHACLFMKIIVDECLTDKQLFF